MCQGLAYLYRRELTFPLGGLRILHLIKAFGRGSDTLLQMFSVAKEDLRFTNCMEDKVHFGDEVSILCLCIMY